ncbi:19198_t:CDS:2 [Entrophospora sp. SA101]|nr:19198_t:CDS:2 [Entrophospora sp. SA101]
MKDNQLTKSETKYLRGLAKKHILLPTKFKKSLVKNWNKYYPEYRSIEKLLELNQEYSLRTGTLIVLPTNQLLQQVWDYIISRPNKKGEYKKSEMECLFLLCWKVGLRVSEALSFDLSLENQESAYKNLYLLRGKGQKER